MLFVVRSALEIAREENRRSKDPTGVVKVDQAQDSGISVPEVVLQHCCWYVLCESDVFVLLDFEIALNSLAHAADRQISKGGWAPSEISEQTTKKKKLKSHALPNGAVTSRNDALD